MACVLQPTPEPLTPAGPPMTRCECAEVSFEEVGRCLHREGLTLDDVARRTGCGGICTACIPDLKRYLESVSPASEPR